MQKKIKQFLNVIAVICLTAALIIGLGKVMRPTETDIAFNAIDTFHSMPEDSFEVICFGSSHMWRGLNVMEMYKNYGIGAYNYGCNWQHINTTDLFIHDAFRTQSPKLVIVETFLVNELLVDTNLDGEIYYTRAIPYSTEKQAYLKQCFGDDPERYLSYYMPLCAFHDNWENLTADNFMPEGNVHVDFLREMPQVEDDFFRTTMGYAYTDYSYPVYLQNPANFEQEELSEDAIAVLDDIVQTCRENNAEILFVTIPIAGTYAYIDAMREYAEQNNCQYVDLLEYTDPMAMDWNLDFSDDAHLNKNGATRVANFLGEYITKNYTLSDMRTIPNNLWEQSMTKYEGLER